MLSNILKYGAIAGIVAGVLVSIQALTISHDVPAAWAMALGFATMLVAFTAVFAGIKRRRDGDLGGVIRFWPAFGMGLAMSVLASIIYAVTWDIFSSLSGGDFAAEYARMMVDQAKASGATGAALDKAVADAEAFRINYANPLYRLPMTFMEIFPMGVLVSLVSAALLRNSQFMPARAA